MPISLRKVMKFDKLETIVLARDLPEHGLQEGDLGAVVQLYAPDGLEVEFVTAAGKTRALVTLTSDDLDDLSTKVDKTPLQRFGVALARSASARPCSEGLRD